MNSAELRHPLLPGDASKPTTAAGISGPILDSSSAHPAGKAKYGRFRAFLRAISVFVYFASGCLTYGPSSYSLGRKRDLSDMCTAYTLLRSSVPHYTTPTATSTMRICP
ncbi:hypothetical protein F5Y00DRAFT_122111 [Daldinia vernicosa]|uniref:uncharacterized protein n=1 Tax=Daldinia vernicosa TaxID=114800 RepID=UPI002007EBD8|nr:uncharacterized protein F5Y00DRAFT_122111 [Daldinia vernicosa]KAI0847166.1 hypothetical protein F5Y00DRAFT_122111 [Daldinia vernicosa]